MEAAIPKHTAFTSQESDMLVGIFVGEVEKLCYKGVGYFVNNSFAKEKDVFFEEAGDDVLLTFFGLSMLDNAVDCFGSASYGSKDWFKGAEFGLFPALSL
eukprot:236354-Ditylum_brightwellii.AAC.1